MTEQRHGHIGILSILDDIYEVLPPEDPRRPEYMRCRTTYGVMNTLLQKARDSDNSRIEYMELEKLEGALRQRLLNLKSRKGVPGKMIQCLDELKAAVAELIEFGPSQVNIMYGIHDFESEDARSDDGVSESRRPAKPVMKLVPETKLQKLRERLAEANAKIADLNMENNNLAMRLRAISLERDRLVGKR